MKCNIVLFITMQTGNAVIQHGTRCKVINYLLNIFQMISSKCSPLSITTLAACNIFCSEVNLHSWAFYKIHQLNLKRKTTETFLRTLAPRMIIIRQGLKRISGCSLGIVKLCLSFFLWLYQLIMMWNKKDEREAVEHNSLKQRKIGGKI